MNSTTEKPRVAFLGLGIMGSGMARRLLRAGFPLTVYNRNTEKTAPFATEGASVAATPREAAERADVIISMVADDAASRGLWLGEHNALAGAATGALLIESSTLTVGWVKELANAAAARGCELLDAPVTGSKAHAAAGELNFLVGGTEAALERARPILSAMGRSIVHVGPTGSGARLKLINNFLCGVQLVSLAEAVSLIEKSGLDRAKALEVLTNGAPGSPLVKTVSARMESRDYAPNFPLRLMAKDLGYALGEAGQYRVPLATVAAALKVFEKAVADGHGGEDFSAIVEQYRQT
jgi:3-hydroxyisobutyrate dehydrogenase